MSEQDTELQDSQNLTEPEVQVQETSPSEEVDWKARAEEIEEKNKQLYARLKKQEQKPEEPKLTNAAPETDAKFERLELKTDGYNTEEVDFLMQYGGKEALANKFVQKAIEVMRKEAKSAQATPDGGAQSPIYKKYTRDELNAMSVEELEKLLPHAQ